MSRARDLTMGGGRARTPGLAVRLAAFTRAARPDIDAYRAVLAEAEGRRLTGREGTALGAARIRFELLTGEWPAHWGGNPYRHHAYVRAVRQVLAADRPSLSRWLTDVCPDCDRRVRADNPNPPDHIVDHIIDVVWAGPAGYEMPVVSVIVGCDGYHVINPAAVGVDAPGWHDWTGDGELAAP